jgi:hypothetical protein
MWARRGHGGGYRYLRYADKPEQPSNRASHSNCSGSQNARHAAGLFSDTRGVPGPAGASDRPFNVWTNGPAAAPCGTPIVQRMADAPSWWDLADGVVYGDIPRPADATTVDHWQTTNAGVTSRFFDCSARKVGAVAVIVAGEQFEDGYCWRTINIYGENDSIGELTPTDGRRLAAALLEAADEIDRLAAHA